MGRLLVLVLLALALVGCTDDSKVVDTVTLYDVNGAVVAHYDARAEDVHLWGGIGQKGGISLTTLTGQGIDWPGAYLVVEGK